MSLVFFYYCCRRRLYSQFTSLNLEGHQKAETAKAKKVPRSIIQSQRAKRS